MILFTREVFYSVIHGQANTRYSDGDASDLMGQADQLVVQANVTNATSSTTLTVNLEHSNDGASTANWKTKTTLANGISLTQNTNETFIWTDPGTTPTARYARLAVFITGANASVNIQLIVTGRTKC
jgi:hypothetical protein